ncbi:unnamed protein product [Ectocarpus sp. 8 AP-2014]
MGEKLSGFDQWDAIIGRRSTEEGPVRKDLVLGRKSYGLNSDDEMVKLSAPGGAYIYKGWKVMLQQRCSLWETSKGPHPDNVKCDSGDPCTSCSSTCDGPLFDYLFHIETDPLETENLKDEMPETFVEMVERFSAATRDEVFPAYKPEEPDGVEKWLSFNTWAVAWR